MRLLLVHNYYGSQAPSGENQVFELESRLLQAAGHEVEKVVVSNDEIRQDKLSPLLAKGVLVPWSPRGFRAIRRVANSFKPSVIHFHNTFPLLSPSVFYAAKTLTPKPAVVMTAHNYRMFCAVGNCMRKNTVCTKCIDSGNPIYAFLYGCYRESRVATLPVTAMIILHAALHTYQKCIDFVIAQTDFQKQILLNARLASKSVVVIPHCVVPLSERLPWSERENKAVFIGRLSPQKGLDLLLEVWERLGRNAPQLIIIGGGPLEQKYRAECREKGLDDRIQFLGFVSESEKWEQLRQCKFLLMPTQWYETFGLVFAEAFSMAVPVIASNIGCISQVVQNGREGQLLDPKDIDQWVDTVQYFMGNNALLKHMSDCCYARYAKEYSARAHLSLLENFYNLAANGHS